MSNYNRRDFLKLTGGAVAASFAMGYGSFAIGGAAKKVVVVGGGPAVRLCRTVMWGHRRREFQFAIEKKKGLGGHPFGQVGGRAGPMELFKAVVGWPGNGDEHFAGGNTIFDPKVGIRNIGDAPTALGESFSQSGQNHSRMFPVGFLHGREQGEWRIKHGCRVENQAAMERMSEGDFFQEIAVEGSLRDRFNHSQGEIGLGQGRQHVQRRDRRMPLR